MLKTKITVLIDISLTNAGKPVIMIRPSWRGEKRQRSSLKLFFPRRKWIEQISTLITGEVPVASAAPNIPNPSGKINT